ncbi:hypothetical protein ACSV9I_08355 [Rhizobium sp. G187]
MSLGSVFGLEPEDGSATGSVVGVGAGVGFDGGLVDVLPVELVVSRG